MLEPHALYHPTVLYVEAGHHARQQSRRRGRSRCGHDLGPCQPATQQTGSVRAGQLGVELARDHAVAFLLQRRDEPYAVGGPRGRPTGGSVAQGVGVGECRDACSHQPSARGRRHRVPAEVRHPHVAGKAAAGARNQAEASDAGRLFARLAQQLHAQADAEQRRATGGHVPDGAVEPACPQGAHPRAERAHSRKHHARRLPHDYGVARDGDARAQPHEPARDRRQVGDAGVDNDDVSHRASPW